MAAAERKETTGDVVRKRLVFYVSGYDPRGPSHYHKLYTAEAEKQSSLNGMELEIGRRRKVNRLSHAWDISLKSTGTKTEYEFLRWDDLIRKNWPKNELGLLRVATPAYWSYLKSNLIGRMWKFSWPVALTIAYPAVVLFGLLFLALGLSLAALILPPVFGMAWWVGIVPAIVICFGALGLSRWSDVKLHTYWLLRTSSTTAVWAEGKRPEIDSRIEEFADYVSERIEASDADEVLVIGHSLGTIMVIPLVARMLRRNPQLGVNGPDLAMVTLGSCIQMASLLPGADRLREEMKQVATAPGVRWADFFAKRDGACISGADPLVTSGISRPEGAKVSPTHHAVRIARMFSAEDYAEVKKDIFRVHFQYLMAGDRPTDYDYFELTAGPAFLRDHLSESIVS